ncbi:unnamed protein product, partial [Symbiodinium necroappetens]
MMTVKKMKTIMVMTILTSDYVRAPETKGTTILLFYCALKLLAFHLTYHAAMARGCPALCTLLVVLGACGAFSGSFVTGRLPGCSPPARVEAQTRRASDGDRTSRRGFLVPVLLCALRQAQEAEHGSAALQSEVSGDQSKWTQCCVTQDTGNIAIKSHTFRQDAVEILGNITYAGAYGWKDGFNIYPYKEHCLHALQLDICPMVQQTLFDDFGVFKSYARVIEMIRAFDAKHHFKTESYWLRAPACPDGMESATDADRCTQDLESFLQFLRVFKTSMER